MKFINNNIKKRIHLSNSVYVLRKQLLTSDRDRFFNCIIDFFFIIIFIFVCTFFVLLAENVFQIGIYGIWEKALDELGFVGSCLSFAVIYYLIFESLFSRTIGKIVTGSIVVNENGIKPNFKMVCLRTVCRLIPFDVFSFLGKSGRFWHDSISKTYVVEKKDLEQDMENFYSLDLIGKKEVI
ncbi:RDD family protein [Flavobacterium johnsoniae]|uniref:RDD family protein n=1 Tax=Flavobacterium johnsoniae TaxID=986 RepID=UPI0025B14847|nr:RDD family protein [Flavobacterium johnsoniae]WJS96204.1 RDD family protein [Flavobacterium johnsoniae]